MNNAILTSKDLKINPNLLKEVKEYIERNDLDEAYNVDDPDFMISITEINRKNIRNISAKNGFISNSNEVINLI
ncbi:hypothetical protein [Mammaliicoccus lentus]|uniref:hypothetical protein n=1 Tax=Mammaliicoccus lentus TaxID=42858 RepID=UPI001071B5FC|nr:hypothetical protein [Mammaliicoccus lentus]MBF0795192.1 hypothetical protein [Mammaliicoccus lentus]TFV14593.1 hypothetical protein E4T78_11045 [Mammaliicoccus lentus]